MWSPVTDIALLLCVYGCCCASGEEKPFFISRNFKNVLRWNKVDSPGEVVRYNVEYTRYGEKPGLACQNISSLSCDLSVETAYDYHTSYYLAQVYANGKLLGETDRFRPMINTVLGAPTLKVTSTASSLHVNISLPLGPDGRTSIEDVFKRRPFSNSLPLTLYILTITHPNWAEQVYENTTGQFVVRHRRRDVTEYCGSVVYKPYREAHRPPSENATFCVTLAGDPWQPFPWSITAAGLILVSILITTVFICRYVRAKASLPDSVKLTKSDSPPMLLHLPEDIISKAELGELSSSEELLLKAAHYHTQQRVFTTQQSRRPEDSDNSHQSSTIYSTVVVQVPTEGARGCQPNAQDDRDDSDQLWTPETGAVQPSWHPGGRFSPESDQERDSRNTLMLPTRRNSNGLLELPGPLLQPDTQSSMVGLTLHANPEGLAFLPNLATAGEMAPLLSDVFNMGDAEWLDPVPGTEEKTIYTSNQVVITCQDATFPYSLPPSGYKQNWLPRTSLGFMLEDSESDPLQCTRLELREDEEEEERTSDEIFLGGWMLQIQG